MSYFLLDIVVGQVTLIVLNYTAPALIREDVQSVSKKLVGQMMDSAPEMTAGLFLGPTFSYKVGTLFNDEFLLLKGFNDCGIHVDLQAQLIFDPKSKSDTCL